MPKHWYLERLQLTFNINQNQDTHFCGRLFVEPAIGLAVRPLLNECVA
jgi:hypothetical protein